MPDMVRVLRVTEIVGPRNLVERQLSKELRDGTHQLRHGQITMRVATLGDYPEILTKDD